MLRVDLNDDNFGPWCLWIILDVVDGSEELTLGQMLLPDYENKPHTAMAVPDGYEQVPYFAIAGP